MKKGFTLVEMIVAVALFAIVMVIAIGAIFTIVDANKRAQSLNSVITNLNFAVESMLRDIRTGTVYACGGVFAPPTLPSTQNCTAGNSSIVFLNSESNIVQYILVGESIVKNIDIPNSSGPITAPEVHIEDLKFYVDGAVPDTTNRQPHMLVRIKGYAGINNTQSYFDIQTYVSQRSLNI